MLLSLGTWQAQKYINKTSFQNSDICMHDIGMIVTANFTSIQENKYIDCKNKLSITGTVLPNAIIPVGPRTHDGQAGYHIYAPVKGEDDTYIFVNLGWSPIKEPQIKADQVSVQGAFFEPSGPNIFTPESNPENKEWYYFDVVKTSALLGIENVSSYALFATHISSEIIKPFIPAELSRSYLTPQMHLQYASFWYLLSVVLLIVFIFRFVLVRH